MVVTGNPVALTIAGFDPSSGAGITADLATFAAHGVFGTSAITALTVQSTLGVRRVEPVPAELLLDTLMTLHADLPPAGIKIGMLGGREQVLAVVGYLQSCGAAKPVVVLDPVITSSSGADLLEADAIGHLLNDLLPHVSAITPNAAELCRLTNMPCATQPERFLAANTLAAGRRMTVVVTGGDLPQPVDLVLEEGRVTELRGEHMSTYATHGTGCAFSAAMLCNMLQGQSATEAARGAKAYVETAMRTAVPRGSGSGPMNLLWPLHRERDRED